MTGRPLPESPSPLRCIREERRAWSSREERVDGEGERKAGDIEGERKGAGDEREEDRQIWRVKRSSRRTNGRDNVERRRDGETASTVEKPGSAAVSGFPAPRFTGPPFWSVFPEDRRESDFVSDLLEAISAVTTRARARVVSQACMPLLQD